MRQGGAVFGTPIDIPPGSVSYGYFWRSRPYTVYRMRAGDRIVAHRFDAVAGVRYREGEVAYRDLALDWWVTAENELIEEDREEFEELREAGVFSAGDLAAAARAERVIARAGERLLPEGMAPGPGAALRDHVGGAGATATQGGRHPRPSNLQGRDPTGLCAGNLR